MIRTSHHDGGGAYLLLDGTRQMKGNLDIGSHDLKTTNMAIYEGTSTVMYVTNTAHSSYRDILCSKFRCSGALPTSLQMKFYTKSRNDSDIILQCYDTADRNMIHLINGQIRMGYLPAADPADGNNRLWKKTILGEDHLMVGT